MAQRPARNLRVLAPKAAAWAVTPDQRFEEGGVLLRVSRRRHVVAGLTTGPKRRTHYQRQNLDIAERRSFDSRVGGGKGGRNSINVNEASPLTGWHRGKAAVGLEIGPLDR